MRFIRTLLIILISFLFLSNTIRYAHAVAADMYVTTSGAGDNSGDSWANAMALSDWETDVEVSAEAGDRYFVEQGTYTLTNNWGTGLDGNATSPIEILGVLTGTTAEPPTSSDWTNTTNGPLIAAAGWNFVFDNYWVLRGIRFTGTTSDGVICDVGCNYINLKADTTGTSRNALNKFGGPGSIIGCEATASSGGAIRVITTGGHLISGNYTHDSTTCIFLGRFNGAVVGNIMDSCITGLAMTDEFSYIVSNNTFFGDKDNEASSVTAITGSTAYSNLIVNNLFDNWDTGASWTTDQGTNIFDYNMWSNNTTDVSNVTKGSNAITSNVTLTDAVNGDFTLPSGAAAIDAGFQVGTNQGATGDYKWNIGVDQDDVAAGVGGASSYTWVQ